MILKAAGRIDEYISSIDPYELIRIFSIAINQGDSKILSLILSDSEHLDHFHTLMKDRTSFMIRDFPEPQIDKWTISH